jgi:hypothetical protein
MTGCVSFYMPVSAGNTLHGDVIMTIKSAGLVLALLLGTGFGAAAAPLTQPGGIAAQTAAAEPVRHYYRHWRRRSYHRGYWWQPDFWGSWRYFGPYTNRTNTHMF